MASLPTQSIILDGHRFKMTEGIVQSTNTQLIIDKLTKEQCERVLREADKIKSTVQSNPVKKQLLQGIIMGCLRK